MLVAILLLAYVASAGLMYRFFQGAYSEGGVFGNLNADRGTLLFTFMPVLNTLFWLTLMFVVGDRADGKEKQPTEGRFFNRFFGVKK
jgi:hypothetical protein